MTKTFPETHPFSGYNEPFRAEVDLHDLIVEGDLPEEINGTWYRVTPDPQYPPLLGEDMYIAGDGMVSSFTFDKGHVDFKSRYVRTERFIAEREAGRALFGLYRNQYTDDPSVEGVERGTANTMAFCHAGKLFALKEDSLPVELDPKTLETKGRYTFDNKLKSKTVTAHPKVDPITGEWIFYGFEASGDASTDVAYCVVDKNGNLTKEEWFQVPYVSFMHDFAVTQDYVIFFVFPATTSVEQLKQGGYHWYWDNSKDTHVGIMPRNGSVKDIRWFTGPACYAFHVMNAYNEGNKIYADLCVSNVVGFTEVQDIGGTQFAPEDHLPFLNRFTFDLSQPGDSYELKPLSPLPGELPRVDDRLQTLPYTVGYYGSIDPSKPLHPIGPMEVGFNQLTRINVETGELKSYHFGDYTTIQEPQFVPSKDSEGYLLLVVDQHDKNTGFVAVMDAGNIEGGPIAKIKLPIRLRSSLHGNWAQASDR